MAVKRERGANWSLSEVMFITEFVEKNDHILKSKQTNILTNAKKNEKWMELTDKLNSMGVQKRTVEQVKCKWGNLQQSAKKTFTEEKIYRKTTGGGPPPKPPTATEEKIIEMKKDKPNFSGIVGGFESSIPLIGLNKDSLLPQASSMTLNAVQDPPAECHSERSCQEIDSSASVNKTIPPNLPKQKERKKIKLDDLQRIQYEVLCAQKVKIEKEIEREEMEKEKCRLTNEKLKLEIILLQQNIEQNETTIYTLKTLSDE